LQDKQSPLPSPKVPHVAHLGRSRGAAVAAPLEYDDVQAFSATVSADGSRIFSWDRDGLVGVWDVASRATRETGTCLV
jgi:hypothetical protein